MINYERTPYKAIGRHGSKVQQRNAHRQREWRRAKDLAHNYPQFNAELWRTLGRDLPPWMMVAGPRPDNYDINGKPIGLLQATALLGDIKARRIGLAQIGDYEVSTVHIPGPAHYTSDGRPLIFETRVTSRNSEEQHWLAPTKKRARVMHRQICDMVRHTVSQESRGVCPHSGELFRACKISDMCDCFDYPEHEHFRQGEVGD